MIEIALHKITRRETRSRLQHKILSISGTFYVFILLDRKKPSKNLNVVG